MIHSFDINVATQYGINEALILQNLYFWRAKNEANQTNFFDNHYWTYNSVEAWQKLFPYLSKDKIKNALKNLMEKNLIISGSYNENKYDQTKWYALTDFALCILQNSPMEFAKLTNRMVENTKCLNNTVLNTVSKPVINTLEDEYKKFNKISNSQSIVKKDVELVIQYFNEKFNKNLYKKGSTYKQIESYVKQIIKAGDTVDDIKLVIDYKKANPNTKKHLLEAWINTKYFATNLNAAQTWHDSGRLQIAEFSLNSNQNPMSALLQENLNLINSGMFVPPSDYVESEQ